MYGLRLLRQRPVQIVALGFVGLLVVAVRAFQFALWTREVQWGYDFTYYWTAARHILDGLPIYSAAQLAGPYAPQGQDGFLYPPPFAAVMVPLAALFSDPKAAAWVWSGLGASVLVVSVLAVARAERLGDRYPILAGRGVLLLVLAAFAFPPVVGELVLGNVHLVLLGLLTLAWLGVRRGDSGGQWIAGAAVGAAAIIKVFPGLLVLWFVLTRRRRAAAGAVAAIAVISVLTVPITDVQPWLDYPTVLANLSAPADNRDTLAPTVWLADALGFTVARIVVTVVGLAIVAWTALRRAPTSHPAYASVDIRSSNPSPAMARYFAIAVTVSILIAPALYHHYLALLVLPFLLGLAAGVPIPWLALAYVLMWGGEQAALGDASWIVNRGLPTAGVLVLLGGLLFGRERAHAGVPTPAMTARSPGPP